MDAKDRVNKALGSVGILASSAIWYVVGEGMSIREFCQRQHASYKCSNRDEARGIIITSLDILARHYGLQNKS